MGGLLFVSVSFDFILFRPTDIPLKNPRNEVKNVTKAMNMATIGDKINAHIHTEIANKANLIVVI